jgi:mannose-1-phosphate guanylyltransferase
MSGYSENRPWGNFRILLKDANIQVKRLEINPGLQFSLQKHLKRTERWIVAQGQGLAIVGKTQMTVAPGSFVEIPCGEIHRMKNTGKEPLVIIEVQFGDYLGEDDIVRLQDDFNRT